jgi:pimeloyl-ACP methyl ester carboxylesterase
MPFCQVNGIRLRYETWGVGVAPLVLIHGLGSSADDWFLQLEAFAPHFRCVALDLRGHGLSGKPPGPYSVPLFASDVAALLRQLDAAPAHVLGLSLGGMVAQQLAIAHPQVVRRLVLLNTLPGVWPPPRRMLRQGVRRFSTPWRPRTMAEQARSVAEDLFPDRAQEHFRTLAVQRILNNDPQAYREATLAIARFFPGAALGRIAGPVLIVAGNDDRIVAPVYQQRLRRGIPQARFETVAGGHACNIDHAVEVNTLVLTWLLQEDPYAARA